MAAFITEIYLLNWPRRWVYRIAMSLRLRHDSRLLKLLITVVSQFKCKNDPFKPKFEHILNLLMNELTNVESATLLKIISLTPSLAQGSIDKTKPLARRP